MQKLYFGSIYQWYIEMCLMSDLYGWNLCSILDDDDGGGDWW